MSKDSLTASNPIPKKVQEWLSIRLLGEPFVEMDESGKIRRGYIFEGKKYSELGVLDG